MVRIHQGRLRKQLLAKGKGWQLLIPIQTTLQVISVRPDVL